MKKLWVLALLFMNNIFALTLDELKEKGVMRVGIIDDYPPFAYNNGKGEIVGSNVDIAQAVATAVLGPEGKLEVVKIDRNDRIKSLVNKELDWVIAAFDRNKVSNSRILEQIRFGAPYLRVELSIISSQEKPINSVGELQSLKVAIKTDPKTFANMKKRLPSVELERFDTPEETLAALKSGKVAAIIGENRDFWALLTKNRDLKISVDSLETMESARPIFRQEDRELEEAVSAEIRTLTSSGKLKEIYSKNFKAFYGGGFNCDVLIPQDKN